MFQATQLLTFLTCTWIIIGTVESQNGGSRGLKSIQFDNVTHMDNLSCRAMKKMHDELDNDDDGNVSILEGVNFIAGNLGEVSGKNKNLPGFETDMDGRITEKEFWDSWIKSQVHNWTNKEMVTWLKYEAEMPQYTGNFQILNISGSAFPLLACNSSIVSALVDGSKENRLKLMLKAKEIVLFGPSKPKSSWLKDMLLTFSLALALSGIAFGVHVKRTANSTILAIEEKMKLLQTGIDKMQEDEMEWRQRDATRQDDEGSNSTEGEDASREAFSISSDEVFVQGKLAETMRELDATKEALRNAQKQLSKRRDSSELPQDLLTTLKATYQAETRLFEMKKKQVNDHVEHTKAQFQKIERNRTTLLGILQVVHSRQVDNFDSEVQQTRDEFRDLQSIIKERRKRWLTLEQICKYKFLPSSLSSNPSRIQSTKPQSLELLEAKWNAESAASKKKASQSKKSPLSDRKKHMREKSILSDSGLARRSSMDSISIPSHASSPALSMQMNGHSFKEGNRSPLTPKLNHSESSMPLSSPNISPLSSIPESGSQTLPRSPQTGKKMEPLHFNSSSPRAEKKSPFMRRTKISLDEMKRSESSVSLPHIQDFESTSSTDSVAKRLSLVLDTTDPLHSGLERKDSPKDKSNSTLERTRKTNLKIRSFFTFKTRKK